MFYFFYALIWTLSWLPMGVLYVFSDLMYPLIYYLVRYRGKIVRRNLIHAFPDYTLEQIIKTEKKFYRFFCDLMMEIIKQLHISDKEMNRRMSFENLDSLTKHLEEGKNVMIMMGHYCNWEWNVVFSLLVPEGVQISPIYQRLKNKRFDRLMLRLRNRYGAVNIERNNLIREIIEMEAQGTRCIFGMISDQSPKAKNIRYRMRFLNQDTPVFLGTEQLAKKYDYPVYYMEVTRLRRGYYRAVFKPLSVEPRATREYEITTKFMQMLEQHIRLQPEFWLWSHNRWKHSKTVGS